MAMRLSPGFFARRFAAFPSSKGTTSFRSLARPASTAYAARVGRPEIGLAVDSGLYSIDRASLRGDVKSCPAPAIARAGINTARSLGTELPEYFD